MAAGATVAAEWGLVPGVALSEAQMARLTTDIVWLVEREVTQADGTTHKVLVPQLYACVRDGDLDASGALIAGNDVQLATAGDLTTSGTIAGRQVVALTAENIADLRGRIAGRDVAVQAAHDLAVLGGSIEAERTLLASAGNNLSAANDVKLKAEDEIKLLAARNYSELHGSSESSSVGIGVSIGTDGPLLTVGASRARGNEDGNDGVWRASQVNAGKTLIIESGGDTTLKGAVASGEQVAAKVGGNLSIASVQDTSQYDSKEQSLGGSISIGLGGVSGNLSASQSKVTSDYASVARQSGIKAGDGGFQVEVKGTTDLKGAVIASTEQAVQDGKNRFATVGLTLSDIENRAEYEASASSVNFGSALSFAGKLALGGTGTGIGTESGSAASTTHSGISGIAGNQAVRSGDAETGIAKIFDADKVKQDIAAQVQITQLFGQQVSKAVGDYAAGKMAEASALREAAKMETSPERISALEAQAQSLEAQWGDQGSMRLAAHTLVGGLTGGLGGAVGAAAGTLTAPAVAKALSDANVDSNLAAVLTALASSAAGAAVGGSAGVGTALNEVANNYLDHRPTRMLGLSEKERYEKADSECKGGSASSCRTRDELAALSTSRDSRLASACSGENRALCNTLANEAWAMGNIVRGSYGGFVYANSPESGTIRFLNTATIGTPNRPTGFDTQLAPTMGSGIVIAGAIALGPEALASKSVAGAVINSGFDAFGQLTDPGNGPYRPWQSVVAAGTGAVAAPFLGRNILINGFVGGLSSGAGTEITNTIYGRNEVVWVSALNGGVFAIGGVVGGKAAASTFKALPSPWPSYIGGTVDNLISGAPSYMPWLFNSSGETKK